MVMKTEHKDTEKNKKKINQALTAGGGGNLIICNNGCRGLDGREAASKETLKAVYRCGLAVSIPVTKMRTLPSQLGRSTCIFLYAGWGPIRFKFSGCREFLLLFSRSTASTNDRF